MLLLFFKTISADCCTGRDLYAGVSFIVRKGLTFFFRTTGRLPFTHAHTLVRTHARSLSHTHAHTHTHTHTHAHTHTHTHTHTHKCIENMDPSAGRDFLAPLIKQMTFSLPGLVCSSVRLDHDSVQPAAKSNSISRTTHCPPYTHHSVTELVSVSTVHKFEPCCGRILPTYLPPPPLSLSPRTACSSTILTFVSYRAYLEVDTQPWI